MERFCVFPGGGEEGWDGDNPTKAYISRFLNQVASKLTCMRTDITVV